MRAAKSRTVLRTAQVESRLQKISQEKSLVASYQERPAPAHCVYAACVEGHSAADGPVGSDGRA